MTSETLMTLASLGIAVAVALGLVHATFSIAYLIDLLTGHGVPPLRFFGTLLVTCVSTGALTVLARYRNAL